MLGNLNQFRNNTNNLDDHVPEPKVQLSDINKDNWKTFKQMLKNLIHDHVKSIYPEEEWQTEFIRLASFIKSYAEIKSHIYLIHEP